MKTLRQLMDERLQKGIAGTIDSLLGLLQYLGSLSTTSYDDETFTANNIMSTPCRHAICKYCVAIITTQSRLSIPEWIDLTEEVIVKLVTKCPNYLKELEYEKSEF